MKMYKPGFNAHIPCGGLVPRGKEAVTAITPQGRLSNRNPCMRRSDILLDRNAHNQWEMLQTLTWSRDRATDSQHAIKECQKH